jgi:predicted N-formylglutamate amidohydrolase
MAATEPRLVLSCEHGGHRIPEPWAPLFRGKTRELESHRGWDPGALSVARRLARRFEAPLIAATTSRLLVDLNRSPHNPAVFSRTTRSLPPDEREAILERVHRPHWQRVREMLDAVDGRVLHVAVHSFAPVLGGRVRAFDVALLYDPARRRESELAARWKHNLVAEAPWLRVRRNAPYRGRSDGLPTAMRRERPATRYLGIELELNQASIEPRTRRTEVFEAVCSALRASL